MVLKNEPGDPPYKTYTLALCTISHLIFVLFDIVNLVFLLGFIIS